MTGQPNERVQYEARDGVAILTLDELPAASIPMLTSVTLSFRYARIVGRSAAIG